MKLSPHFDSDEFACPCCGLCDISPKLLERLERIRVNLGPIHVNSGHRCNRHNEAVDGSENSAHLNGLAADIQVFGSKARFIALDMALEVGFRRIGMYNTFIHLDVSEDLPQDVIWYE